MKGLKETSRRGFLKMAGIASAVLPTILAFKGPVGFKDFYKPGPVKFPEDLVPLEKISYNEIGSPTNLAAEMLLEIKRQKPDLKLEFVGESFIGPETPYHITTDAKFARSVSRDIEVFREEVIKPMASSFVKKLNLCKPTKCGQLSVPRGGIDQVKIISDTESGLSIRYIQMYEINLDLFVHRFDILVG